MVDLDLLAYLESFVSEERKSRFRDVLSNRTNFITVVTEDVFQVHNTSAVIRSCDVFGIQTAHLIEERFGNRLDKNIAMGAQQWVDVHSYKTASDCLKNLRSKGYMLVATTPERKAHSLDDFPLKKPIALCFGTEKEGLSDEILDQSDYQLKIPMVGFTQSLNISVSAAIILHKLTQELRNSDHPWQLTEEEKVMKQLDWTMKSINHVEEILARYKKDAKI
ncbi:MAG: RNA methyltransferase [Bacteroidia bacterium]|nr:RNA methyltransferase [Bacteroidia bacterium]